ncbi:MAG: hypothetical protein KF784_12260 [Fimbriimonadaceae bacterium]|nr:hypothetical protein [Fimbriimonadaceae bacterium]
MHWSGRLIFLAVVLLISSESNAQSSSSDHFSLGLRASDGSYRTHLYSYANGRFVETIQPGALFAPTGNGLKQVLVERKKTKDWIEDFLLVGPASQTPKAPEIDKDSADLLRGYSKTSITFVGPNYVGVEDSSEGATKSGISAFGYRELRFYSLTNPTASLAIGNAIKGAEIDFAKAAIEAYRKAPDELRPKLSPTPDHTNWSLKFTKDGWEAFGRLGYLLERDRGVFYEFPIPIKVPKEIASVIGPNATTISPDGSWSVSFEKDTVRLKTRGKGGAPANQQVFRLNGADVVMTIWSKRS